MKALAQAVRDALISSDEDDGNVVDALSSMARALAVGLNRLGNGDASTPMGAIEAHAAAVLAASDNIAGAIRELAEAIRDHNND